MAITQFTPNFNFGGQLGQALGTGLGGVLEGLSQRQANKTQAKKFEQAGLPGFLSSLDPRVQAAYLKQYGAAQQMGRQNSLLDQYLSPQGAQQGQPQDVQSALAQQLGMPQAQEQQAGNNFFDNIGMQQPQQQQQVEQQPQRLSPERRIKQDVDRLTRALSDQRISPADKNFLRGEIDKREQQLSKYVKESNKATQPFYDEVSAYKEAADVSDKRLNRMSQLIEKGSLPNSAFYSTLKSIEENVNPAAGAAVGGALGGLFGGAGALPAAGIGAAVGGLINPLATLAKQGYKKIATDTDEFEKLSNDFIREAKNIFGSRITDADLKVFLSLVPTLSATDEGKKAIIRNLKNFNQASRVKYKAMRDIIKENDGLRPLDLQDQVSDRTQVRLDKLSDKFTTGQALD